MAKKKKDKKNYWMKYGGHTSKMFPKAEYGDVLGAIGDSNMLQGLNTVLPGAGSLLDFGVDYLNFRNQKRENKKKRRMGTKAMEFALRQQDPDANKDTLNMDTVTASAEGVSENMHIKDPNFAQDVLLPGVMQAGSFALKGGFSKENMANTWGKLFKGNTPNANNTLALADDIGDDLTNQVLAKYGKHSYMGGGPAAQDLYEAEGGEVIQHNIDEVPGTTGNLKPVADNPMLSEIQGSSHSQGGELVDGGAGDQVVYSKTLKTDMLGKKMSFADAAKYIAKKIKGFEEAAITGDAITKNTATQMIQAWTVKMQQLQVQQEKARRQQFQKMVSEGTGLEELAQNFPDLTQEFMQQQGPSGGAEQELLGAQTMAYGGYPKYAYGSPEADPNDPPFYPRTDESVDAIQNSFGVYGEGENSFLVYGNDPGIQDYINSLPGGLEEFGDLWIQNVDPAILKAAGVTKFSDLKDQDKIRQLQIAFNKANEGKEGFTPIPVDAEGMGKFGEWTMSIATGWDELKENSTIDSPVHENDEVELGDLGDIEDPLADDDGIMEDEEEIDILTGGGDDDEIQFEELDIEDDIEEEEEIITNMEDIVLKPGDQEEEEINLEKEPVGPVATGDPLLDWGYEIKPDPEIEFTELDIEDEEEEEEEIVYDIDGNVIYDPNEKVEQETPITLPKPGEIKLDTYKGVKLPPNNQTGKKDPPPYMGDAPYTDIVAENAGVTLQPPPGGEEDDSFWTGGYFTGQDLDDPPPPGGDIFGGTGEDPPYRSKNRWWERSGRKDKEDTEDITKGGGGDELFGPFPKKRDPNPITLWSKEKRQAWNQKRKKNKENRKNNKKNNTIINNNGNNTNTSGNTNRQRANAFGNLFNGKLLAPLYNFMKYREGADVEKKHANPFESRIIDMANQNVDIQPWLNQNMSNLKTGMNFSKDFAGGSGLQMFNMYNRLNQGKNIADSEAWKYKRDKDIELQAQGAQMLYNLGEQERAEDIRVSDANLQNQAALDNHLKSALEQLSAIGQMDENTRNLMRNDEIRMKLINQMAPDLDKYMQDNPGASYEEALTALLSTEKGQLLMQELSMMETNLGVATEFGNYQSLANTKLAQENEELKKKLAALEGGEVVNDTLLTDDEILGGNENPINNEEIIVNPDNTGGDPNDTTGGDPDDEIIITDDETDDEIEDPIDDPIDDYTPVIDTDQQATLTPLTIKSTGPGAAKIFVDGQPITATVKDPVLGAFDINITGIRAEGDALKVDVEKPTLFGGTQDAVEDFGEFVRDDSKPSGWKWVGTENYDLFINSDEATAEQKAMFKNFIAAIEGDVRYADGVRNHITTGEGDISGTQLNDLIKNKPE